MLSNYCGLGGSGKTRHRTDWICKKHDDAYTALVDAGVDPYWLYNEADATMLDDMEKYPPQQWEEYIIQNAAKFIWKAKSWFLPHQDSLSNSPSEEEDEEMAPTMRLTNTPHQSATGHKRARHSLDFSDPTENHGTISAQEGTEGADQSAPGVEGALEPIHRVWRRFPNVETASLKWIYTQLLGGNATNNLEFRPSGSAWDQQRKRDIALADTYTNAQDNLSTVAGTTILNTPMLMQFRMTSPYNIVKSDSGNKSEPQWIGFFDSKYQYYHVAKCNWSLSFTLGLNTAQLATTLSTWQEQQYFAFYVYWKYTSEDDPPTQFAIDTTGKTTYNGSPLNLTPDDYDRMGGWNKVWIHGDNRRLERKVITGSYETGQCRMDVKMINDPKHGGVATAEGWTAVKSTTAFPENLSVILVADNAYTTQLVATEVNIGIRAECEYLVQFRDLQSKYKFPTQSQTIGATADDGQFFFRGAAQISPVSSAATAPVGTYN